MDLEKVKKLLEFIKLLQAYAGTTPAAGAWSTPTTCTRSLSHAMRI